MEVHRAEQRSAARIKSQHRTLAAECKVELEVSHALDEFEALVISFISDFLSLQQVYDPSAGPGFSPRAFNMDKKLFKMSELLRHFDPETQKLLQLQVLNELHTEQRNFNIIKASPCVKPLVEVQELVLQFKSELSQAAEVEKAKGHRDMQIVCGSNEPFLNRTHRLSQLITDLKRCLTATYVDVANMNREQIRPAIRKTQSEGGVVRLPSPRVIPSTHYKRVLDKITSGDDCCQPCPSVYAPNVLWKRYSGPPLPPGTTDPAQRHYILGQSGPYAIRKPPSEISPYEELNRQSALPYKLDPNKFRLFKKKSDSSCCAADTTVDGIMTKSFAKMLNNENYGINTFEETMHAYTRLSNSIPLVWAGFGPDDEPLLFPATGLSFTHLPVNPNLTMGGYPWKSGMSNFAKIGMDGNPVYQNKNWTPSSASFFDDSDMGDSDWRSRHGSKGYRDSKGIYHPGRYGDYHGGGRRGQDGEGRRQGSGDRGYRRGGDRADWERGRDSHGARDRRKYRDQPDTFELHHRHRHRPGRHAHGVDGIYPSSSFANGIFRKGEGQTGYGGNQYRADYHRGPDGRDGRRRRNRSDDPETYREGRRRKGERYDDTESIGKDGKRRRRGKSDEPETYREGGRRRKGKRDDDDDDALPLRRSGRKKGGKYGDDDDDALSLRRSGRKKGGKYGDDDDDALSLRRSGRKKGGKYGDDDASSRAGGRRKGGDGPKGRRKGGKGDEDFDSETNLGSGRRKGAKGKLRGKVSDLDRDEAGSTTSKTKLRDKSKRRRGRKSGRKSDLDIDGAKLAMYVSGVGDEGGGSGRKAAAKKGKKKRKKKRSSDEDSEEDVAVTRHPHGDHRIQGIKPSNVQVGVIVHNVEEDPKTRRAKELAERNKAIADRLTAARARNKARLQKLQEESMAKSGIQQKPRVIPKTVPKFRTRARLIRPPDAAGLVIGGSGDDDVFYPLSKLDKQQRRWKGDDYMGEDAPSFVANATAVNTSWELAKDLFKTKTPFHAMTVPPPENVLSFIQNKFPLLKWSVGPPRAVRYYPNGDIFCATFKNGSGMVFYPHGGLAIAISAPTPFNHVVVMRDPYDKFYFLDKSVLADFDCIGKGAVYHYDGVVQLQYNTIGGFRNDGMNKVTKRWQWNRGGHRMIVKLNGYMSLRILDLTRIQLVFYGNKRGLRFNVGPDDRVINLIKINPQGSFNRRPEPCFPDNYDYHRGKFNPPIIGFMDKTKLPEPRHDDRDEEDSPQTTTVAHMNQMGQGDHLPLLGTRDQLPQLAYEYSFRQCEALDNQLPPLIYDCNVSHCAINPPGSAFIC